MSGVPVQEQRRFIDSQNPYGSSRKLSINTGGNPGSVSYDEDASVYGKRIDAGEQALKRARTTLNSDPLDESALEALKRIRDDMSTLIQQQQVIDTIRRRKRQDGLRRGRTTSAESNAAVTANVELRAINLLSRNHENNA